MVENTEAYKIAMQPFSAPNRVENTAAYQTAMKPFSSSGAVYSNAHPFAVEPPGSVAPYVDATSSSNPRGSFISQATHLINYSSEGSQIRNYAPAVYNLDQLPQNVIGNNAVFEQYAPKSWLQSSPAQLEALNNSFLHINDAAFQGDFLVSAPQQVQQVISQSYTGQNQYLTSNNQQHSDDLSALRGAEDAYIGYQAIKNGGTALRSAYQTGQTYLSAAQGGEEATALGESAIAGIESAGASVGIEGGGALVADAIGAGALGVGIGTLGVGLAVGAAAYAGYEFATNYLGAPTLTEDETYIGNGLRSAVSTFDSWFNP